MIIKAYLKNLGISFKTIFKGGIIKYVMFAFIQLLAFIPFFAPLAYSSRYSLARQIKEKENISIYKSFDGINRANNYYKMLIINLICFIFIASFISLITLIIQFIVKGEQDLMIILYLLYLLPLALYINYIPNYFITMKFEDETITDVLTNNSKNSISCFFKTLLIIILSLLIIIIPIIIFIILFDVNNGINIQEGIEFLMIVCYILIFILIIIPLFYLTLSLTLYDLYNKIIIKKDETIIINASNIKYNKIKTN